jgi:hypothetical protein
MDTQGRGLFVIVASITLTAALSLEKASGTFYIQLLVTADVNGKWARFLSCTYSDACTNIMLAPAHHLKHFGF